MDTSAFVQSFREAAPYIHTFRGQTFVIGFGGELVESDRFSQLSHDINLLVSLGIRIVLVHGARPQVESLLALRGQTRQHHRSRRITDATAMDAVKYGIGYTRAEIEAQLSVALPDSPMAGANLRVAGGNYLVACPMGVLDGVDMQYSGAVRRVDTQAITQRLAAGELVLLSPIGYSPTGESFSLSMEEVAAHTATSLKADKLMYLVDTPTGVHSASGQLLREFSPEEGQAWLESSADHLPGEFRLCFASAIKAAGLGVKRCHLVSQSVDGALLKELFTHAGSGTVVSDAPLVVLRQARFDDLQRLLQIIRPLEQEGKLVPREEEMIELNLDHYTVVEHDGKLTGCVAMFDYPESGMAELCCLAVAPPWRFRGYGEALLHHVEQRARDKHIDTLFVLTTQTAHFFIERGFALTSPDVLPPVKRQHYNPERGSKVLVRRLSTPHA